MARGAVVILQDEKVALIERRRYGKLYYLFPGGTVEDGETAADAAIREAKEELGVDVELYRLLAIVRYQANLQQYFLAGIVGGTFGTGTEYEMQSLEDSELGSFTPVWMPLTDLASLDVRPKRLADAIAAGNARVMPVIDYDEAT